MYHFIREGDIVPAALFVKDLINSFSAILNGLSSLGGKLIIEPIIKHFLPKTWTFTDIDNIIDIFEDIKNTVDKNSNAYPYTPIGNYVLGIQSALRGF